MPGRVVYAATHSWSSPIRVGSHHFAKALARQSSVLYMPHPISLPSVLSRRDNQLSSRFSAWRKGLKASHVPGLQEINWIMPFCPGASGPLQSSIAVEHGWKLCFPDPHKVFNTAGYMQPEALWIDSLFQNYWPDILHPEKLFVRVADHPSFITDLSKPLRRKLITTLNRATMIVTPTISIASYLGNLTKTDIHCIPNGADVQHFSKNTEVPLEYEKRPGPHVVFVGAIASWIDLQLIRETAQLCPEFSFWLIGPNHSQDMRNNPANLNYLGSISYQDIPAYLQHANAALAPFNVSAFPEFIESIDAIKLYEYISAGTPVVATRWEQSQRLAPYVVATNQNAASFRDNLIKVIEKPERHIAGSAYLKNIDWYARMVSIKKLVG